MLVLARTFRGFLKDNSAFLLISIFVLLAVLVGIIVFFMAKRSRLMRQPPQFLCGRVLEKRPTAMNEEDILVELSDGTRKHFLTNASKIMLVPGDSGNFEIRGGFIMGFAPVTPNR